MSPSIESIAVEDLDKKLEEPKADAIETYEEIVEPIIEIKEQVKAKRIYKPRIKKEIIKEPSPPNSPIKIPDKIVKEIEVVKDPVVELDQREEPNSPVRMKTKKKEPVMTCPNCEKEMLAKTYKYYHSLKCAPQNGGYPSTRGKPLSKNEDIIPIKEEVKEIELPKIEKEKEITLQAPSSNRHIQRRDFFKNLVKSAF